MQPVQMWISVYNKLGIDGRALLSALRADRKFAKMAFILLTGCLSKKIVQRAVQLGANNYLGNPFTAARIKQEIELVSGPLT